jgi:tetratricopeptide (TPR) repeat protein
MSPGVPRIPGLRDSLPGAAYKKGDVIGGKYEVYGVLGRGGFGIVYLVFSRETEAVYALKTFRDEYLADAQTRERFRREASVWVDLERHPYLVRAHFVDEVAGRLFIAMEYVAPDEDGLNTLEAHLRHKSPDLAQSLRWAVQFCYGIEYAYSKGMRCHRDIKPANMMIGLDKAVRITDFGLAGVLGPSQAMSGFKLSIQQGTVGLSGQTIEGTGFGTPTYMPPEQFADAASCDERSDIYSFGVVLFQMASGGRLPFLAPLPTVVAESESARFWREMHRLHAHAPVPTLNSPLFPLIRRCLQKDAHERYVGFAELRADIEPMLKHQTGETIRPPASKSLEAWEWYNRGNSLDLLGRGEEAIRCYDTAIAISPQEAKAWFNKAVCLGGLRRDEEAIRCCDRALVLDQRYAAAWHNKGLCLFRLGRNEEARRCYETTLELEPWRSDDWHALGIILTNRGQYEESIRCFDRVLELNPRNVQAWACKGNSLARLDRCEEAIHCCDRALDLDPRDAAALNNKGISIGRLGHHEEAIQCFNKALEADPRFAAAWLSKGLAQEELGERTGAAWSYKQFIALAAEQYPKQVQYARERLSGLEASASTKAAEARVWHKRGNGLAGAGRLEEAIRCYDEAVALDPRLAVAWHNKGHILYKMGRHEEAIRCYDRALELNPRDARAWCNKGISLNSLGRYEDAVCSYDEALAFDPRDATAWSNKGNCLDLMGRREEAIRCYDKALELDPRDALAWYNKGISLYSLGRNEEAIRCYDRALELNPRDARAWCNKGAAQEELDRREDAVRSYKQFIALAPSQYAEQVELAKQRIRELEGV